MCSNGKQFSIGDDGMKKDGNQPPGNSRQGEAQNVSLNLEEICRFADRVFFKNLINLQKGECIMNQASIHSTHINGVNVDRLQTTLGAIQENPSLSKFQFRATNRWVYGGHNQTTIQEFYGAGQEDTSRTKPFVFDADEPPVLLGEDKGANPVEFVLHALASCLTTSMVYHAAAQGIRIEEVTSHLEGDLDLQGFLGLSPTIRNGYQNIRVRLTVKSEASAEKLRELCSRSPVFDIVSNPVPVNVTVETH